MPKNKHNSSKRFKPLFILTIIVLAIAVGTTSFFVTKYLSEKKKPENNSQPVTNTTQNPTKTGRTTKESSQKSTEQPEELPHKPEESPSTEADSTDKTPEQYSEENANTTETITGTITTARFSGDNLIIRVNIDQYLSSGTCELTLTDSASNTFSKVANISPSAFTSTCEGFDLTTTDLNPIARPPVDINIKLISGEKTGTITGRVD